MRIRRRCHLVAAPRLPNLHVSATHAADAPRRLQALGPRCVRDHRRACPVAPLSIVDVMLLLLLLPRRPRHGREEGKRSWPSVACAAADFDEERA